MKDIPMFATDNGVAALSLQQIPYTGIAHITIHSSHDPDLFLDECVGFCRAVGAEQILACGDKFLESFPVFTRILQMQLETPIDTQDACLFPVTDKSLDKWLEIYNNGMRNVPNATILSKQMARSFAENGTAYFVHHNEEVLGIGVVEKDAIRAIVSCKKGAGECVMKTLCGAIVGDIVIVEVAENNVPAMNLYKRMGFVPTKYLSIWYDVTKNICFVK